MPFVVGSVVMGELDGVVIVKREGAVLGMNLGCPVTSTGGVA